MRLRNTSARIINLNLPSGVVPLAPLQTLFLDADAAKAAKAVLDSALKALVDDGSLVIDPKDGPQPPTATPNAQGAPNTTPNAGSEPSTPSSGDPPTGTDAPTSGSRKR